MANPPVCRIMDYGKFRYEEAQKAKESRKKTSNVSVKEVKFRPKIGQGDFDTKIRNVIRFIEEGHKVKVTLQFRGREMAHPELGSEDPRRRARRSGSGTARSRRRPVSKDAHVDGAGTRQEGTRGHRRRQPPKPIIRMPILWMSIIPRSITSR